MNDQLKHDLRHWLTALLGALETDDARLARRIAEQMVALLGEPRPAVVSVNDVLRDMAPLLGARVAPAEPDVCLRADPAALGRLLMNLATNGRAAMLDGGTLTLRAGRDGAHATIAVEDTGPGILPDVLARMFEPGFTTHAATGGCGLGLATVRQIVEAAGGTVTAESMVGRGTIVVVRWPLESPPPVLPSSITILLVEDEPIVRTLAERALRQAGYDVILAGSADAALTAVQTLTPDAVVTDLTLPGMDGRALIAALRERWPKLPAVVVSGYADSAASADPESEKTVFLAKPYALTELMVAIGMVVRD